MMLPSSAHGVATGVGAGSAASLPGVQHVHQDILFSGYFNKAGDDNNRWKRRYFQLVTSLPTVLGSASTRARLQYFENDKDVAKGKPARGEVGIQDILGLAVFGRAGASDAVIQSCQSLTSQHVQDGPLKLMIWTSDRVWRLAEISTDTNVTGDLIRALDRLRLIPKVSVRGVGWMRTQDASLDQLRRRLDLARALDIKPLNPLVPVGSAAEKRVLKYLALSTGGSTNSWEADIAANGFEFVGIRVRHPDIPDKQGYVMCVENQPGETTEDHYARFRQWIVQLQLSAAEARLSEFTITETSNATAMRGSSSEGNQDLMERKLLQIVNSTQQLSMSRDTVLSIVYSYLTRFQSFPDLWRATLWFASSGGASLKKNLTATYSSLIPREDPSVRTAAQRVYAALVKMDRNLINLQDNIRFLLQFGGEECVFWILASLVLDSSSLLTSSTVGQNVSTTCLSEFYHEGLAGYVESQVVLDILGLTNPSMVAHITAYDLTPSIISSCLDFFARCRHPRVWDGITVWGEDALSFAAVSLINSKKDILECFSNEDMSKTMTTAFSDLSVIIRWDSMDTKLIDQIRRAKWSSVTETIREYIAYIKLWRRVSEEARTWATRINEQLNRLFTHEGAGNPPEEQSLSMLHRLSTKIISGSGRIQGLCTGIEEDLVKELAKHKATASEGLLSTKTYQNLREVSLNGDDLTPLMETLFEALLASSWTLLCLGWKKWVTANFLAEKVCRFVPRASINRWGVGSANQIASSSNVPIGGSPPIDSPTLGSTTPTTAAGVTIPSKNVSLQSTGGGPQGNSSGGQGGAASLDESIQSHQDSSSLKSLAIGLGKRLFQQRFMTTHDNPATLPAPAMPLLPSPKATSRTEKDKPPKSPTFEDETDSMSLLSKYRGGYIGLCEYAGSTVDAAVIRNSMLNDDKLVHCLDALDMFLRSADYIEKLLQWMVNRDSFVPLTTFPPHLKRLFLSRQIAFDEAKLKSLTDSLTLLKHRSMRNAAPS